MKKLLLAFALTAFVGCKQAPITPNQKTAEAIPENPIETTIVNYLMENLNDPSSYQSIDFKVLTKRDTIRHGMSDDEIRKMLILDYTEERDRLTQIGDHEGAEAANKKLSDIANHIAKFKELDNASFEYHYVIHNFRAKNEFGALIKYSYFYTLRPKEPVNSILDIDLTKLEVFDSDEITEE